MKKTKVKPYNGIHFQNTYYLTKKPFIWNSYNSILWKEEIKINGQKFEHCIREDIWMANNYITHVHYVIWKMQIATSNKYLLTSIRVSHVKKTNNIKVLQECRTYTTDKNLNYNRSDSSVVSLEVKHVLTICPHN